MIRSMSTKPACEVSLRLLTALGHVARGEPRILSLSLYCAASRISKLRGLQDELGRAPDMLPLIPDGVADEEDAEDHPDLHPSPSKMPRLLMQGGEGAAGQPSSVAALLAEDSPMAAADATNAPSAEAVPAEPAPPTFLSRPRSCYICKRRFRKLVRGAEGVGGRIGVGVSGAGTQEAWQCPLPPSPPLCSTTSTTRCARSARPSSAWW